jgi:hypothetical protein
MKKQQQVTRVWQKWRLSAPQTHLWLINHCGSASTFVMEIATFAKRRNDVKNRPSGQFFTTIPRYAGNVKPSLLSHDVLTSPALLDFPSRASSLGKPRKAGAR